MTAGEFVTWLEGYLEGIGSKFDKKQMAKIAKRAASVTVQGYPVAPPYPFPYPVMPDPFPYPNPSAPYVDTSTTSNKIVFNKDKKPPKKTLTKGCKGLDVGIMAELNMAEMPMGKSTKGDSI